MSKLKETSAWKALEAHYATVRDLHMRDLFAEDPAVTFDVLATADADGDGEWDAVWIAGFGTSRPARGIATDLEARALVLEWKSTTVAVVSLDLVGYFHSDIEKAREQHGARSEALMTFVVQLSCGHSEYLPTTRAIRGGGYSAELYLVGPKGGRVLVDEAVERINAFWP